jgi:DNA-binding NarL/FixJ family response regulator
VDRHPIWLDALDRVLQRLGIDVAGRTDSPHEALEIITKERPALVVLGLEEPSGDGEVAFIRSARSAAPEAVIAVCSDRRDEADIAACLEAGAAAYIVKTLTEADLLAAIGQAFDRTIYLLSHLGRARSPDGDGAETAGALTEREREVLRLVANGYSNSEVAQRLWLSAATVKLHLSHIYGKLGVKNRTAASAWAHAHGLVADADAARHSAASYTRRAAADVAVGT